MKYSKAKAIVEAIEQLFEARLEKDRSVSLEDLYEKRLVYEMAQQMLIDKLTDIMTED